MEAATDILLLTILQIRPHRLPRHTSFISLAVVYHPLSSSIKDNNLLKDHLQSNTDLFLVDHPDALVIITGDFNPSSTKLNTNLISRCLFMSQIIKCNTRDTGILDLYFVNKPILFESPKQLQKVGNSDHYAILVKPLTQSCSNSTKSVIFKREIRESSLANFGRWISRMNWNIVYRLNDPNEKYSLFHHLLSSATEKVFPSKEIQKVII